MGGGDRSGEGGTRAGGENHGRLEKARGTKRGPLTRSVSKSERDERSSRTGDRVANSIVPWHFPLSHFHLSSSPFLPRYLWSLFFPRYPRGDSRSQDAGRPFEGRRNVPPKPHQIESRAFSPTRGGRGRRDGFNFSLVAPAAFGLTLSRSREPVRQPIGRGGLGC